MDGLTLSFAMLGLAYVLVWLIDTGWQWLRRMYYARIWARKGNAALNIAPVRKRKERHE